MQVFLLQGSGREYPAFREELVTALVESLLGHRQGIIHGLEPLEGADGSGSLVGVAKIAARIQAAGELADWLGTARIALQVSLLCMTPLTSSPQNSRLLKTPKSQTNYLSLTMAKLP